MKKIINILKLVFLKNKYISSLCKYYGSPQEVRDYLQDMADKYQILSKFLKNDIEKFDREVEEEYQNYLENLNYIREKENGCYDCPWGNGEGGCTIPGYCTS